MGIERADTDLDQARRKALLHDASEGGGVRIAITGLAFTIAAQRELVVQITVGVEVQHGGGLRAAREAAQDRIGDRVIAAEHKRSVPAKNELRIRSSMAARARGASSGRSTSPASSNTPGAERSSPRSL